MIKYFCKHPACNNLVDKQNIYCQEHIDFQIEEDNKKIMKNKKWCKSPNQHLYNSLRWRKIKEIKLLNNNRCDKCGSFTRLEVHHIIPPRGNTELFYNLDNLQTLCSKCHLEETKREIQERKHK